jgi:hypothetical protein
VKAGSPINGTKNPAGCPAGSASETVRFSMGALLDSPVWSPTLRWQLRTIGEAMDYINIRLSEGEQNHKLVQAACEVLYRAEDTGVKVVASTKLANVLSVMEISRS